MENQVIVTLPSRDLRAIARESLKGMWKKGFVISLLYYVLMTLPVSIIGAVFPITSPAQLVGGLYDILVTGPFTFGISLFFLCVFRKRESDYGQLFAGFENFGKTFMLMLIIFVKTLLWSLLFIVPGIVASFRYSQAFYILIDHPEYTPNQCIEESKKMMNGNKGKLFCLMFSFIGWMFLAGIPVSIVSSIEQTEPAASIGGRLLYVALNFVAMVGVYILMPYVQAASIAFYEILAGNLKEIVVDEETATDADTAETVEENVEETVEEVVVDEAAEGVEGAEPTNPATQIVEEVEVQWHKDE